MNPTQNFDITFSVGSLFIFVNLSVYLTKTPVTNQPNQNSTLQNSLVPNALAIAIPLFSLHSLSIYVYIYTPLSWQFLINPSENFIKFLVWESSNGRMKTMYLHKVDHHHHHHQLRKISSLRVHVAAGDDRKVCQNFMVRYFNPRTFGIMVVLTLSLLLLPLVLPPLPPPPVMILFVPVLIMILLIFLAFSPSRIPNDSANSAV